MGIKQFHIRVLGTSILASWSWDSLGDQLRFEPIVSPPRFPSVPAITGIARVGATLTLIDGVVTNGTITGRRLLRDNVAISFTGTTYVPQPEDLNAVLVYENTAEGLGGEKTVISAPVLIGPAGISLDVAGVGSAGVTSGFLALPEVSAYTATAGRFRRSPAGFVRCAANEERLCFDNAGLFTGQYLQGADTYHSAPWDDVGAPHTSSDPAYLTTSAGGTIAYAGAHSDADLFGTTGKGVVITQTGTVNGFFTASAIPLTGLIAGDLMRFECIVAISGAAGAGEVTLGTSANGTNIHTWQHDASGNITGFTEAWTTRRAGFHDLGTINGKRWFYLWVDALATNTNNATVRIGFGSGAAQAGKKYHVCELMARKNPATPPAAVPVCAAAKTFAVDTLDTGFVDAGYVMTGLAMARSQMTAGAIVPPSINVGVPYEPLETRIEIIAGVELADRSGILPNANQVFYGRPWRAAGTTRTLFFGPGWLARDWYRATTNDDNCLNLNVRSVFQAREDKIALLGNMTTSNARITGALSVDGVGLVCGGDTRTKYMEQSDVLAGTGASFFFQAFGNVSVTNCLVIGSTLWPTRARHLIQQDDDTSDSAGAKCVFAGELALQSSGGALSLQGTRSHNLARSVVSGFAAATALSLNTTDNCATRFWMDQLFVGQGTYSSWSASRMFGALTTARTDMFFCQSERPIRISTDSGETWTDLPPSFDLKAMPHGFLGEHVGTYNFDTAVFTATPDPAKALRVRYWGFDSVASPAVQKPGFQWLGSQMDMGTFTKLPNAGDVFRVKNGTQWIDVTYQGGWWTGSGYTRNTGAQIDNSVNNSAAISNDFIQVNRQLATMNGSNVFDGCVMVGPKGAYFITGDPGLPSNGSALDNFFVTNSFVMSDGSNAMRWDHSLTNPADLTVSNFLIIEARSKFTYVDGTGISLSFGGAGARNVLTIGSNVTGITSSQGGSALLGAQNGATYVNAGAVRTILCGRRNAYNTWTTPDAKVAQYLPSANFDAFEGRAVLPTYADLWDFNLTAFADTDAGFGVRSVITAAKGTHARWNDKIADIKAKFHKVPDLVVTIPNSTAVGTNLGAATGQIDRIEGGDHERRFEIIGGQLQVRRALTGLNAVYMLRTTTGQLLIVDVTP